MLEAVFDRTFSALAVDVVTDACACAFLPRESALRSLPLSESLAVTKEPFLDFGRLLEESACAGPVLECRHDWAEWGRSPLRLRGPAGLCLPVSNKAPSI
ncbi:unnamed protein product [Acanthoscelides obtectus]|uniref:Uncharacterized protein n=1 Tax=Acanthoscelides obtectus TaxID=200917 RepID=A0A9P0PZ51_ACAOB|nr:unnamed protein product [Acanthoscelides obtectus]CAH2014545.1 unnamed protein product [Acanthoscelides obtectus]CAK1683083.1 hypothetical protein AOBTE_LOCUS34068 [Acanthoscelides obtectus]CAK1683101.1 hypothetical protein AOBTE_LOCUS34078 [Acanthoscelides obtectus]